MFPSIDDKTMEWSNNTIPEIVLANGLKQKWNRIR